MTDGNESGNGPTETNWHKILEPGELDEGRVTTVSVGIRSFAVTRHEGVYGCLDNACPHQGGPLGEGSIENGWLRCPWHGYDYSPTTGEPPGGFSDAPACFPTEVRDDGVYVALPSEPEHARTVSRRDRRDAHQLGPDPRVRHGRPLEPRVRRRNAQGRGARRAHLHRHPPRGSGRVRRLCLRQADRPGRRLFRHRRTRFDEPADRVCTTPRKTGRRCWRSPVRCRPRCAAEGRSRTPISRRPSATSPSSARRCRPAPTTPSSPRWR